MQNYVDGGEAVVQAFRSLGVDYVMASPGSEWGAVWEALARQKVTNTPGPIYLSCAHETLAVDLAMKKEHHAFYPDGVSAANDLFYGEPITDLDYAELPKLFGGFGRRVEKLTDLSAAVKEGLAATREGKTATLNVMVDL